MCTQANRVLMQPSLLKARKRLVPLVWLLALAVLAPASSHLAQGLVLCIGAGHVEVEATGSGHHDGRSKTPASVSRTLAIPAPPTPVFRKRSEREDVPCLDVPLRFARAADLCHQAVKSEAPNVAPFALPVLAHAFSMDDDAPDASHPLPRPPKRRLSPDVSALRRSSTAGLRTMSA